MVEYDMVVHVENLDEYQAVLETWFKKGYNWAWPLKKEFKDIYFTLYNARYLVLDDKTVCHSTGLAIDTTKAISFKEFVAKERGKVTYEVSEEQLAFIKSVKESLYPATDLTGKFNDYSIMFGNCEYAEEFERDLLRYLGRDDGVVFKVKEPRYLLKGKNNDGDTVYFTFSFSEAPTYTFDETNAFKAPYDEIVRWKNSFWKLEQVDA